jgi:hypothetical protein
LLIRDNVHGKGAESNLRYELKIILSRTHRGSVAMFLPWDQDQTFGQSPETRTNRPTGMWSGARSFTLVLSVTHITVIALLTVPALLAIATGTRLLRRAFQRTEFLPEELALAGAWVFMVASLVWLGAFLSGSTLLGFGAPWTWLAAAHFAFAGFGSLTLTALCCRAVSDARSLKTLRILLIAHPIAYLVTAAGISGFAYCDEVGAASYELIFITQLAAFLFGRPDRISRGTRLLVALALTVPVGTMVPALAWACGQPILDMTGMVHYHGLVNAIGHVGLGLAAFAIGRPKSHSPMREAAHQAR